MPSTAEFRLSITRALTSRVDSAHFDAMYPANLNLACAGISAGAYPMVELLRRVKTALPFVFRYQDGNRRPDAQPAVYRQTSVSISVDSPTADEVFTVIAAALPDDWQVIALPGYVIMYHERRDYLSARQVYGDVPGRALGIPKQPG
jgi:hypothetical protein